MDSVRSSVDAIYISSLGIFLESMYFALFKLVRAIELVRLYGTSGLYIYAFGSRATWRLQAQVLGQLRDEDAFAFKKSVTDECTMISVAVQTIGSFTTYFGLTYIAGRSCRSDQHDSPVPELPQ